jgi:hypothetical protein
VMYNQVFSMMITKHMSIAISFTSMYVGA